jgi:hypothetical protein
MDIVARKEWIVVERREDHVLLEEEGGGARHRLAPDLLPEDVSPGDRFRVVAQLDRRADADLAPPALDGGSAERSEAVFSEALDTLSRM